MIFTSEIMVILRALEVGQYFVVRPPGVAEGCPMVVIGSMAADIHHRIDRRGSTESLAPRLVAQSAIKPTLRHSRELPVIEGASDHQEKGCRCSYEPAVVATPCLQQRH